MIALAIFGHGPRADAAYQPAAFGPAVRVGLDAVVDPEDTPDRSPDHKLGIESGALRHPPPGGSPTTGPTTGRDGPPAGLPQTAEAVSPGLVAYFRDPPGSLDPSHFIASILDPPRAACARPAADRPTRQPAPPT